MSSWIQLVRKEIRLGMPAFFIPIILFIIVSGAAYFIGERNGYGVPIMSGVALMATGAQLLYMPYFLFYSLQAERKKMHLWLHNPLPATSLVLAKMVAALLAMIVTLIITIGTWFATTPIHSFLKTPTVELTMWNFIEIGLWIVVHLILLSISISITFIFLWMIFLLLNRSLGTFVSFLSTFVFFIVVASAYGWLSMTTFYEKLTQWGEFKFSNMLTSIDITTNAGDVDVITGLSNMTVYAGDYVFEVVIALVLFFLACWILERKVEV